MTSSMLLAADYDDCNSYPIDSATDVCALGSAGNSLDQHRCDRLYDTLECKFGKIPLKFVFLQLDEFRMLSQ